MALYCIWPTAIIRLYSPFRIAIPASTTSPLKIHESTVSLKLAAYLPSGWVEVGTVEGEETYTKCVTTKQCNLATY